MSRRTKKGESAFCILMPGAVYSKLDVLARQLGTSKKALIISALGLLFDKFEDAVNYEDLMVRLETLKKREIEHAGH